MLRSLLALALLATVAAAQAGFSVTNETFGLDLACDMDQAPDGRIFIVERLTGNVRVYDAASGTLDPTPWATIGPLTANAFAENGLLGVAVHPNFTQNGWVYFYYTASGPTRNRVVRLQDVGGVGTNLTVIMDNIPANTIHNGGVMEFGHDGKLYILNGDAASANAAQNTSNLRGKIFRLNDDGTAPGDNPFAGGGGLASVWSYGHRNQRGVAIHPQTGILYTSENGQNSTDETNRIVAGGNYGWPIHEGNESVPDPSTVDPLTFYSPTPDPTGADFYTGTNYPDEYVDNFFFGSWGQQYIRRIVLDGAGTGTTLDQVWHQPANGTIFDVLDAADGDLLFLHSNGAFDRGANKLRRMNYDSAPDTRLNMKGNVLGQNTSITWTRNPGDVALLLISLSKLDTPIDVGNLGTLEIGASLLNILLPVPAGASGTAYLPATLPSDGSLEGTTLYMQALVGSGGNDKELSNLKEITLQQ